MKLVLYKKNEKVLSFNIYIGIMTFKILEIDILNKKLLPIGLRNIFTANNSKLQSAILESWLAIRSIPDNRVDLDNYMINRYCLNFYSGALGRMQNMGHTASLLSGYYTGTDDYYVMPEKDEFIFYGMEDVRFNTLYLLKHYNSYNEFLSDFNNDSEYAKKLFLNCYQKRETFFCKTMTDNINSKFPVCAYKENGKIVFEEKVFANNEKIAKCICELYEEINKSNTKDDNKVKAYFSDASIPDEKRIITNISIKDDYSFSNIKNAFLEYVIVNGKKEPNVLMCLKNVLAVNVYNIFIRWLERNDISILDINNMNISAGKDGKCLLIL